MEDSIIGIGVSQDNRKIDVNGQTLRLDLLDGWDQLSSPQQKYLAEYAKNPHNKTLAHMALGYSKSEVDRWFEEQSFSSVSEQIFDVYTQFLKGVDYQDALTNSKIRGRVIQAQERGGKYSEEKKTEHNHLHVYNMRQLMDDLKK